MEVVAFRSGAAGLATMGVSALIVRHRRSTASLEAGLASAGSAVSAGSPSLSWSEGLFGPRELRPLLIGRGAVGSVAFGSLYAAYPYLTVS